MCEKKGVLSFKKERRSLLLAVKATRDECSVQSAQLISWEDGASPFDQEGSAAARAPAPVAARPARWAAAWTRPASSWRCRRSAVNASTPASSTKHPPPLNVHISISTITILSIIFISHHPPTLHPANCTRARRAFNWNAWTSDANASTLRPNCDSNRPPSQIWKKTPNRSAWGRAAVRTGDEDERKSRTKTAHQLHDQAAARCPMYRYTGTGYCLRSLPLSVVLLPSIIRCVHSAFRQTQKGRAHTYEWFYFNDLQPPPPQMALPKQRLPVL